jgi:serine protease Do
MIDQSNTPYRAPRRILRPRRLALLASVAGLSMAVLAIAPNGHLPFNLPTLTSPAHAAEPAQTQNIPGFADLVAKVKPAVISVRVKIDSDSENGGLVQNEGFNSRQSDNPFDQFSQQFGFRIPDEMPQHHEIITGEGSGFFISADGYAVTNNHVVDHAKSVQVTTDDGTKYTAKVIGTERRPTSR